MVKIRLAMEKIYWKCIGIYGIFLQKIVINNLKTSTATSVYVHQRFHLSSWTQSINIKIHAFWFAMNFKTSYARFNWHWNLQNEGILTSISRPKFNLAKLFQSSLIWLVTSWGLTLTRETEVFANCWASGTAVMMI